MWYFSEMRLYERVLSVGKNHTIRFQSTSKVPFCTHASATFYHGFKDRLWLCFRVCLYFVRIKWLIRQWDIWNLSPKECRKIRMKFFSNFQRYVFLNWFKTDTKVGMVFQFLWLRCNFIECIGKHDLICTGNVIYWGNVRLKLY